MSLLGWTYEKITKKKPPYYLNYSVLTLALKPIRKWVTNVVAANCPFNCIRIALYRLCGFKIGKNTFIGMRCYLDDLCYKQLVIGDHVTISYGVFFACHGRNQGHYPIVVCDHAYIGMRTSIISKKTPTSDSDLCTSGITIGEYAVVGACTLVNKDVPPHATAVGVPCRIIEGKCK